MNNKKDDKEESITSYKNIWPKFRSIDCLYDTLVFSPLNPVENLTFNYQLIRSYVTDKQSIFLNPHISVERNQA